MSETEDKPRPASNEFGETIRGLREARGLGLRKFALHIGMTPTYLSKIERGEFSPPAEEKVRALAEALDQNPDELLALAGRVASDLSSIIKTQPRAMAHLLRVAQGLPESAIDDLVKRASDYRTSKHRRRS